MKQSLRHQQIIKLVEQSGYLSTEELVAALDVSPQTLDCWLDLGIYR